MNTASILVVDDETAQRDALAGYLKKQGHEVIRASNGREGLDACRDRTVDLIITDVRMPDLDGLAFLGEIKKSSPETAVIVMTAFGSVRDAVTAMKSGAADYVQKPIDLDQLDVVVAKALERRFLVRENRRLQDLLESRKEFSQILAGSPAMEEALSIAARAAVSKVTVLIRGESGTGKEVLARAIHLAGPRKAKHFIAVNLAAFPESLVESELFGHEKGSFTGADRRRKGRFELADGGTLFIDEVGDIPAAGQVKLLRFLQERTFERVGGSATFESDVRVIAATHRDLEEAIRSGQFREDLFYRLNVIVIRIPPLRERREEVPMFVDHFLRKFSREESKAVPSVSGEAMDRLMRHDYPGNVRELENMIQRAVVMTGDEILRPDDLFLPSGKSQSTAAEESLVQRVERLEMQLIREALEKSRDNQSRAAIMLGLSERHLRYKLKKYGFK